MICGKGSAASSSRAERLGSSRRWSISALAMNLLQSGWIVSAAGEFQHANGDNPFFLACRSVPEVLGVSHMLVARLLKDMVCSGILELVERGKALVELAEYRYRCDESHEGAATPQESAVHKKSTV